MILAPSGALNKKPPLQTKLSGGSMSPQEQFAMKLNVSRQEVSNWENNKNLPDIGMKSEIQHENFFLLPSGFLCIFCVLISFMTVGIRAIINKVKSRNC